MRSYVRTMYYQQVETSQTSQMTVVPAQAHRPAPKRRSLIDRNAYVTRSFSPLLDLRRFLRIYKFNELHRGNIFQLLAEYLHGDGFQ